MKFRAVCVGLALLLLAAMPGTTPSNPYVRILTLEAHRSLGHGKLASLLASSDVRIAARAALAIGRAKLASGAPLLVGHSADPRPGVRAMAIYGLGLIGRRGDVARILAALDDPNGAVQVAAIDAMDRYQTAHHLAGFVLIAQGRLAAHLAHSPDAIVRAHAAQALEGFSAPKELAEVTLAALRHAVAFDASTRVRRTAMWSIFRGFAKLAPHTFLREAAQNRDEVIRIEAIRALGSLGDASDAAFLASIARHDDSWRVAEQAGESLRLVRHLPMTEHWKAIPSTIRLPKILPDPLDQLPALPRTPARGKLSAPKPDQALLEPKLNPTDAADMDGPAPGAHPRVRIVTTQGNIYVMLLPEWAPLTVANFLHAANRGYYDKNPWFRVVPDFVVQTGDPHGDGNGDAGYFIPAEENPMMQYSGVISMGLNYTKNAPDRDSAGTQYYITLSPQLHLDRDFTVFGRVIGGWNVLAHITEHDSVLRIERISDAIVPSPKSGA